jgi:hypothetical protein
MRIALIVVAALVSCVFLHTEPAFARPRGDQVAEAKKTRKKLKKKPASKVGKKAAKKVVEETPVARDEEPEPKAVAAAPARRSQAVDDEVPRNEPKKR